jgi:hypothetical protein
MCGGSVIVFDRSSRCAIFRFAASLRQHAEHNRADNEDTT